MTSAIDATKPAEGHAYTADVRSNFAIARDEISFLQDAGPFLPLSGGGLSGSLGVWSATPPAAKPTVTGSRSDGTALASLLTALAAYGLIIDTSTA
jgi:hypothetical protein